MTSFVKWNDLNSFHEVVKSLGHNRLYQVLVKHDYKITFGLKVKLHGTNAAVRIASDGAVTAQKRSSDIPKGSDNAGFRAWVESNEPYFASLALSDATIVIYGEWAGPGVQSGVAVSEIDHKCFFPFAIDFHHEVEGQERIYCPDQMECILGAKLPNDVIVIPWHDKVEIDFASKETTELTLARLNAMTEAVGVNDPFIESIFSTKGCGEGFVCYPFLGSNAGVSYLGAELEHFSHFNFKAKSEHHRVNKTKAAVAFNPERFANKNRFGDAFCTPQRFEQGWNEFTTEARTMKLTPLFIQWVCRDVLKESTTEVAEMAALDVTWTDLSKVVAARAAMWYKAKVSEC